MPFIRRFIKIIIRKRSMIIIGGKISILLVEITLVKLFEIII